MRCGAYNGFFVNFANKTRLDIVMLLMRGALSVNEISKKIGEEQSKVSHNLKKLSECNILTVEQKGKQRFYSLNKQSSVLPMLRLVEKHISDNCAGGCNK